MSERTSRAERRALRRVAGVEVSAVVNDTHAALMALKAEHDTLRRLFEDAQRAALDTRDRVTVAERRIVGLQHACLPLTRGWRGRFAWLVGR